MRYQKKRKAQINTTDVFEVYMDICQRYDIASVYEGRFREALKMLEECGLIKINKGFKITQVLLGILHLMNGKMQCICFRNVLN